MGKAKFLRKLKENAESGDKEYYPYPWGKEIKSKKEVTLPPMPDFSRIRSAESLSFVQPKENLPKKWSLKNIFNWLNN